MRPDEQPKVALVVDKVVGRFVARGAPADGEDMKQQAWQIAIESLPNFDPERGSLEGYLWRAITLSLGNEVSRWLAVPSIPKKQKMGLARTLQARVPLVQDREDGSPGVTVPEVLWDKTTPETAVLSHEWDRRRRGWTNRLRRALMSVLLEFRPWERRMIESQYGLDGRGPVRPETLAARHRVPLSRVYRVSDKFRDRVYRDLDINVLDRELEELFP